MKELVNFFFEVNKLKEIPRTGWLIWRIKNPESIAEHIFRVAFLSYLLSQEKGLRVKNAIQIALSHDLCEVYAGDITPLFYYQNLDIRKKRDREILMKGIRLPAKVKAKMSRLKFKNEKRSLLKLLAFLEKDLKSEIFLKWLDYEKGFSNEGKFVRQVDWIENLIQSLEYLTPKKSGSGWWEIAEEKVYDPFLLEFLKVIQERFYHFKVLKKQKENVSLFGILEFVLKLGKLKRLERTYWKAWGIKKAESVAEHIFLTTLLAWIFGRKRKNLNQEKLLKMALSHEISAAVIGDTIPYIEKLPRSLKERKKLLKKWPRLPENKKAEKFLKQYKNEKKALKIITKNLPEYLRKEIIENWQEYRTVATQEANFLNQLNVLAVLIQGIVYRKKYKITITPLIEWAFEKCDDPEVFSFLRALTNSKRSKNI